MSGRVLVTGGAGMIGSNLVKRLAGMGFRIVVADHTWRGRLGNLVLDNGKPALDVHGDFHRIDISVPGAIDPLLENVDYVFHLADIVAGVGYVFSNQGSIFRQNILINSNVVAAARKVPPRKGFI